MTTQQLPYNTLQNSWLRLTFVWFAIWFAGYLLLLQVFTDAWKWLLLSGITLAYSLWVLWRNLALNHRIHDPSLFPTLGLGNQLSLFRALVIGLLAGFLLMPKPQEALLWVIALLYTAASIVDGIDGYVARRAGQVTILGQRLDMEFDGLGIAVISLLAVWYSQLPPWFLSVGFARYLFVLGIWWRRRTGRQVYEIPDSAHRRVMAGMLMGMMTVVLWPIVPPEMATLAGAVIAIPILLGFTRDWLFTAGYIDSQNQTYRQIQQMLYKLMSRWLPLVWRFLLASAVLFILGAAQPWYQRQAWQELLSSWHMPMPDLFATLLSAVAVGGIIMVFLGFIGRLGAIILLFPIGFDIATRGLVWTNAIALICALCIALLGTGILSMWLPENGFIMQRRGGIKLDES